MFPLAKGLQTKAGFPLGKDLGLLNLRKRSLREVMMAIALFHEPFSQSGAPHGLYLLQKPTALRVRVL